MSTRSKSVPGSLGSGGGGGSAAGGAAVPLAVLLRREVASERTAAERPDLQHGFFNQAKKGEDFFLLKPDCERLPGVPSSSFSAFGVSTLTIVFQLRPPHSCVPDPAALCLYAPRGPLSNSEGGGDAREM
jgi:hypothetical protein